MSAMPVVLLEWKKLEKNTLRGFAKVRIGKALVVSDVTVHASHGKRWASFPSKPLVLSDGTVKRDDAGKITYVPLLSWCDREVSDSFSNAVIAAVEEKHPGDTGA